MPYLTSWLTSRWVAAAGFMAGSLLAILPLLNAVYALPLILIFLHGPCYMFHQIEEHTRDRFRFFVNNRIFHGVDALSSTAVLVINIPLVWGVNLAALYAACLWGTAFALVAPYTMLVNGLTHIAAALRLRCYNPGLGTSLALFLPLSIWTLVVIGPVSASFHFVGLGLALLLHLLIIAHVLFRIRQKPA